MATNGSPPPADAAVSNGGGVSSPQSRRRSLHSPWASVVRGDSEQNPSPTAAAATAAVSPGFSSSPPVEETSVSDNSLIESPGSEPQPESSENNGEHNAGGQRRPAWNRPVNGVVEPVSFMVGASWPTLSETIRSVPRSASESISNGSSPSQLCISLQVLYRDASFILCSTDSPYAYCASFAACDLPPNEPLTNVIVKQIDFFLAIIIW